jgi:hypothetical protein
MSLWCGMGSGSRFGWEVEGGKSLKFDEARKTLAKCFEGILKETREIETQIESNELFFEECVLFNGK